MSHLKQYRAYLFVAMLILAVGATQVFAPYHTPGPPPPAEPPQQESQAANGAVLFTATLTASQEVPAPDGATPATVIGSGVFVYDPSAGVLTFSVAFKGLSGPLTLAHFHNGASGTSGGVVATICNAPGTPLVVVCPSNTSGFLTAQWEVPQELVEPLLQGQLYVNIHTSLNGGGEIRGQVNPL